MANLLFVTGGRMKKNKKQLLDLPDVRETPERSQHSPVDEIDFKPRGGKAVQKVRRVRYEHPLDVIWHRAQITDKAHEAGMRFRSLYERCMFKSRVTARYGATTGVGGGFDEEVIARQEINNVLKNLTRRQAAVIIGVCGHAEFPTVWARRKNWGPMADSPQVMLRQALEEAVRVWKL